MKQNIAVAVEVIPTIEDSKLVIPVIYYNMYFYFQ